MGHPVGHFHQETRDEVLEFWTVVWVIESDLRVTFTQVKHQILRLYQICKVASTYSIALGF